MGWSSKYSSSSFCFEHPRWIGSLRFLDSQDTVGLEGEITIPLIRGSQLSSGGQDSSRFSEEIWFEIPETWKPTWQNAPFTVKRAGADKKKTIVFQPSIFRCDLIVLGRVAVEWYWKYSNKHLSDMEWKVDVMHHGLDCISAWVLLRLSSNSYI